MDCDAVRQRLGEAQYQLDTYSIVLENPTCFSDQQVEEARAELNADPAAAEGEGIESGPSPNTDPEQEMVDKIEQLPPTVRKTLFVQAVREAVPARDLPSDDEQLVDIANLGCEYFDAGLDPEELLTSAADSGIDEQAAAKVLVIGTRTFCPAHGDKLSELQRVADG